MRPRPMEAVTLFIILLDASLRATAASSGLGSPRRETARASLFLPPGAWRALYHERQSHGETPRCPGPALHTRRWHAGAIRSPGFPHLLKRRWAAVGASAAAV